ASRSAPPIGFRPDAHLARGDDAVRIDGIFHRLVPAAQGAIIVAIAAGDLVIKQCVGSILAPSIARRDFYQLAEKRAGALSHLCIVTIKDYHIDMIEIALSGREPAII